MVSGGSLHGSSRAPHSMDRPHRFVSTLCGLSNEGGTGIPRLLAYSIALDLVMHHSRAGARTFTLESSARTIASRRT